MDAATLREDIQHAGQRLRDNLAEGIGRVQEQMEERMRRGSTRRGGCSPRSTTSSAASCRSLR